MSETIRLEVYRRLDNRAEGLGDDSPRALELHNRRRQALHDVLDGIDALTVKDWGYTDDSQPHEVVQLVLALAASPQLQVVVVPALSFVGGLLVKGGLGTAISEGVKALMSRLWPKQQQEQVLDYTIVLPDGSRIRCDPDSTITVNLRGGELYELRYGASEAELPTAQGRDT